MTQSAGRQAAVSAAQTGDVTALCVLDLGDDAIVLAGIGSQLHAYSLPCGAQLLCQPVLPYGIRLHGIVAALPCGPPDSRLLLLAVHGDRHAAVLALDLAAARVLPVCRLPRFHHWTMAAHISAAGQLGGSEGGSRGGATGLPPAVLVAVGLSDNSLQAFRVDISPACFAPAPPSSSIWGAAGSDTAGGCWDGGPAAATRAERLLWVEGAERCLLYSMALHCREQVRRRCQYCKASSRGPAGWASHRI